MVETLTADIERLKVEHEEKYSKVYDEAKVRYAFDVGFSPMSYDPTDGTLFRRQHLSNTDMCSPLFERNWLLPPPNCVTRIQPS